VRPDVLSDRALNRATLERQLLLHRSDRSVLDAVHHLVGLQAQLPLNPYLALWSRLEEFEPDGLAQHLLDRDVVRIVLMRGTIHLVTADDCLELRNLVQPVLDGELARHADHAATLRGLDLAPVLAFARPFLAEPRTGPELRAALAERFPEVDAAALALACRNHLALVQVPPRGLWGRSGQVTITTAEAWLGRPLVERPSIDEVVVRYLGAFGPASVADISTWSRLTGMREVVDRLLPRLRTFRTESGRELFDLPDAPRPDPDVVAPPRFLPEYDNLLLSHADRGRFVSEDDRRQLSAGDRAVRGAVLSDGRLRGTWRVEADGLMIDHLGRLTKKATAALGAEGRRLLRLLAPDAGREVRFTAR
jgi:hypothetical protein